MKKLFAVIMIFAAIFSLAGCPADDENTAKTTLTINNLSGYALLSVEYSGVEFGDINSGKDVANFKYETDNSPFIGRWISADSENRLYIKRLNIFKNGTYFFSDGPFTRAGTWKLNEDTLTLNNIGTVQSRGEDELFMKYEYREYTPTGSSYGKGEIVLKRNNEAPSLSPGSSITNTVEFGTGYIFFQYGTTAYRTYEIIVIEKNEDGVFAFTDNTLVVEPTEPNIQYIVGEL